jgi:Surp module
VEFPKEERVRFVIDTLARFIIEDGTDMEQLLLEAEADNPEFEFLRNVHCPEHMYYRWKLYSLCNDNSMAEWRTDPFVMIQESNRIHPPPLHSRAFQKETAAQRGAIWLRWMTCCVHRLSLQDASDVLWLFHHPSEDIPQVVVNMQVEKGIGRCSYQIWKGKGLRTCFDSFASNVVTSKQQ